MSNSFELLQGSIANIQKQYEMLSDIVIVEHGDKMHGSPSHIIANKDIQLTVYDEVPQGHRDDLKQKFDNFLFVSASRTNY
jgi:hypothetical protein